MQYQII